MHENYPLSTRVDAYQKVDSNLSTRTLNLAQNCLKSFLHGSKIHFVGQKLRILPFISSKFLILVEYVPTRTLNLAQNCFKSSLNGSKIHLGLGFTFRYLWTRVDTYLTNIKNLDDINGNICNCSSTKWIFDPSNELLRRYWA